MNENKQNIYRKLFPSILNLLGKSFAIHELKYERLFNMNILYLNLKISFPGVLHMYIL